MVSREEVREAAVLFVSEAMASLHEEEILPAPRFARFLQVGRDYFGPSLADGPAYLAFVSVLEQAYEERFQHPLTRQDAEFANLYIFSLLEACIARSEGQWPVASTDPAITDSVTELLDVLDSPTYGVAAARQVSHLTTLDGAALRLGDVHIIPVQDKPRELLARLCREIPAAASAWNREPPLSFDPPHSLLVVKNETAHGDPFAEAGELSRRIERFLLTTRLLTSSTTQSAFEIQGQLKLVGRMHPVLRSYSTATVGSLVRRTARLSEADSAAIEAVSELVDSAVVKRDGMVTTPFDVALAKFNRSHRPGDAFELLVDLVTALEAVLTGDTNAEGLSLRLASRAAFLLQTKEDLAGSIYNDVMKLYGLRSKLVHGGPLTEKKLRKDIQEISTVPEGATTAHFGVAIGYAIDRLRDLVRRSILARLCLASGEAPLWPWGSDSSIEGELLDPTVSEAWRRTWHNKLASHGAAEAAGRPRAAVDFISRDDR